MNNKLSMRKMQAIRTKENIIKTAIRLAAKKGIDGFTVRDICSAVNISIGNFYHYFRSKDDVLLHTRQVYDKRILSKIKKIENNDIVQLIITIYEARASFVLERPIEESNVLYILNLKNASNNNRHEYIVDAYILDILRRAKENSKIKSSLTAEEILSMLNTIYHGCCYEYIANNGNYDLLMHLRCLARHLDTYLP